MHLYSVSWVTNKSHAIQQLGYENGAAILSCLFKWTNYSNTKEVHLPSTKSSAEHSATPAALVMRTVKIPESSGRTSRMYRTCLLPSDRIWKSSECGIWMPSRNQVTCGGGVPPTKHSKLADWPSLTSTPPMGFWKLGACTPLVRSGSASLDKAKKGVEKVGGLVMLDGCMI